MVFEAFSNKIPKDYIIFCNIQNPFVEMCVMSKCNYHIIANSSFSWWGAWLAGDNPTQVVVCPSGRYVGWDIEYRVPGHWIRL